MLYTNNSISGIVDTIVSVLPPFFTRKQGTVVHNLIQGISAGCKEIVDLINNVYEQIRINTATDEHLDELIYSYIKEHRKDGETDEEYRDRYIRYVYVYNPTLKGIKQAVYDIYGEYPVRLFELNNRSAYWGKHNLPLSGQISGTASYYDNIGEYTKYWGGNDDIKAYQGYIFLNERPTDEVLNELCKVLNMNRLSGTQISLIFNEVDNGVPIPNIYNNGDIEINSFSIGWS